MTFFALSNQNNPMDHFSGAMFGKRCCATKAAAGTIVIEGEKDPLGLSFAPHNLLSPVPPFDWCAKE
jgi:hypothetical protein